MLLTIFIAQIFKVDLKNNKKTLKIKYLYLVWIFELCCRELSPFIFLTFGRIYKLFIFGWYMYVFFSRIISEGTPPIFWMVNMIGVFLWLRYINLQLRAGDWGETVLVICVDSIESPPCIFLSLRNQPMTLHQCVYPSLNDHVLMHLIWSLDRKNVTGKESCVMTWDLTS